MSQSLLIDPLFVIEIWVDTLTLWSCHSNFLVSFILKVSCQSNFAFLQVVWFFSLVTLQQSVEIMDLFLFILLKTCIFWTWEFMPIFSSEEFSVIILLLSLTLFPHSVVLIRTLSYFLTLDPFYCLPGDFLFINSYFHLCLV